MNTYVNGQKAENAVTEYLKKIGFEILANNWRTRTCEIDIIAIKEKTLHFVEVKYRKSDQQGNGWEYITAGKRKRMAYAAELWVASAKWTGQYQLSCASVSSDDYEIIFLEEI